MFKRKLTNFFIHCRCILVLNVVFVTIGSIYTNFAVKKPNGLNKPSGDTQNKGNNNHQIKCHNVNAVLNVDNSIMYENKQTNKTKIASSFIERFFACFCVVKNSEIITTDSLGTDSIEVIHGMRYQPKDSTYIQWKDVENIKYIFRAIGMIWIIAGHLFFYGPGAVDNLQMVLTYAEDWYLQPLFSVAICVDTYFVIR